MKMSGRGAATGLPLLLLLLAAACSVVLAWSDSTLAPHPTLFYLFINYIYLKNYDV